jgi:hypothetical protein
MANPNRNPSKRSAQGKAILLSCVIFTLWASGCAHTDQRTSFAHGGPATLVPKLTSVTTWPLALLLTNGGGFESEFTMTLTDASGAPLKLSGPLLVRGGKLRLEAAFDKSSDKSARMGSFGVIWDEAAHQGYVLSEALQGYAPITGLVRCTNLLIQVIAGKNERIEGHPVDTANVTVMGTDGQTITAQLLRAQDLGNLPLQIDSQNSPHPFTLALSKIQTIVPKEELFFPPYGFTKYPDETVMLDELETRLYTVLGGKHEIRSSSSDDETGRKNRPMAPNP